MSESIEYKFISRAYDREDTFSVLDFKGIEGLSRNYEFTITLKSLDFNIDLNAVLNKPCVFKRKIGRTESIITGILSRFDQQHQVEDYVLYKAVLVPSLWKLSLYHTNEVYLDMSVPDIIETILKETGFYPTIDYELKLNGTYEKWAYRCQYGESHLSFIKRLMEHEGIYYYFEQSEDDGEKIIFCDNIQNHTKPESSDLNYSPVSGLDITEGYSNIHSFICRNKRMPKKIILKDYNYEKPSLDVVGEAVVDDDGIGEVFIYGDNFNTPEEGAKYAKVRSQELICTKEKFYGEGVVNQISAGYLFSLTGHFRDAFNTDFLVTEIEHEGYAPSYLTESSDLNAQAYMNTFTAIPGDIQFRPKRETEKPKFYGTINAIIDAEGEGKYAEVDDQGRYKVILPFDRVKRGDSGKASCWIRMTQPYSGTTEGMHFPLRKGTEVLLTFVNGDPDQPVISGAVPNAAQPSVVNSDNQTNSVIRTSSGNKIEFEDMDGKNRIKLETPQLNSYMHLGAPNHAGDGWVVMTEGMERKEIKGGQQITVTTSTTPDSSSDKTGSEPISSDIPDGTQAIAITGTILGNVRGYWQYKSNKAGWLSFGGVSNSSALLLGGGDKTRFVPTEGAGTVSFIYKEWDGTDHNAGTMVNPESDDSIGSTEMTSSVTVTEEDIIDERALHIFKHKDPSNGETVTSGPPLDDGYIDSTGQILKEGELSGSYLIERRQGEKYLWTDGNEYVYGGGKVYNFGNSYEESHFRETGIDDGEVEDDIPPTTMPGAIGYDPDNHFVEKVWGDKFEYQFGNNYTWGDTCDYEFGNGYSESHVNFDPATDHIRRKFEKTWPSEKWRSVAKGSEHYGAVGMIAGAIGKGSVFQGNVGDVLNPPPYESEEDKEIVTHAGKITLNADTVGAEKTIGDSYEFSNGDAIEISIGDKEEHSQGNSYEFQYGGRHEETTYADSGVRIAHEWTHDRTAMEQKYDIVTGTLTSTNFIASSGSFEYELNAFHVGKIETTFSAAAEFSLAVTADSKVAIETGVADVAIGTYGTSTDIKFSGNSTEINLCGFAIEIESYPAFFKIEDSQIELKTGAVEISTKEGISFKEAKAEFRKSLSEVSDSNFNIVCCALTLLS